MRKILVYMISGLCMMSLICGCTQKTAVENLDLETTYQALVDMQEDTSEPLVLFPESNADYIESVYEGLSGIELSQQVAYFAPVTGWATEVMLVEVTNEEDVDAVVDIFEARIELGSSDTFYPETAHQWQTQATVHQAGKYVGMIVLPEGYTIPENVFTDLEQ